MNLELITQSEVSQKEKNKHCILTHICGIYKNGADEPVCRAAMETQTRERLVDTVREGAAAAAAAAAKSLQSCPTPCIPRDGSPPGSAVPRILQARTLEWVAISFSNA